MFNSMCDGDGKITFAFQYLRFKKILKFDIFEFLVLSLFEIKHVSL